MNAESRPEAIDALSRLKVGPSSIDLGSYLAAEEDVRRLAPFSHAELALADSLAAEMVQIEGDHSERRAAMTLYLSREVPGATIGEAIETLTLDQLDELTRIAEGEIRLEGLLGDGGELP